MGRCINKFNEKIGDRAYDAGGAESIGDGAEAPAAPPLLLVMGLDSKTVQGSILNLVISYNLSLQILN